MTDADALLASILDRPDDDLPRLVYADWLDENGEHERSEFIRVGCELASMPGYPSAFDLDAYPNAAELHRRQLWLINEWDYGRGWRHIAGRVAVSLIPGGSPWYDYFTFRRGFVWKVECTVVEFLGGPCQRCGGEGTEGHAYDRGMRFDCPTCSGTGRTEGVAAALFRSQPVLSVTLTDRHPTAFQGRSGATLSRWAWNCDDRDRQLDSWIPFELAQCLEGFERDEESTWFYYSTAEAAYAALDAAAVRLGRSFANLRPLEPVV